MKDKGIKLLVCRKFKSWCDSITDENVRSLVEKNTILTGGALASLLDSEIPNDFDFYFRNKETALAVAQYYVKEFGKNPPAQFKDGGAVDISVKEDEDRVKIVVKSAGITGENSGGEDYQYFEHTDPSEQLAAQYVDSAMDSLEGPTEASLPLHTAKEDWENLPKYRPVFLSSNAITLSDGVQIIVRFYGCPEEIHDNFDFVHCTNYWTSWDKKVVWNTEALLALKTLELRYIGSKYPLCSVFRLRKFIERGFTINAGQILKMVLQLQELDLSDVKVLEDQLIGVDVAYFNEVISLLKSKDRDKVDFAYLVEIINRMF